MQRLLFVFLSSMVFLLAGCSQPPKVINNACDILSLHPTWYRYHVHFAHKYSVPIPTVMAIIALESGFNPQARPVKSWLVKNYIPWEYASSSYGYSQATNAAWNDFQRANPYSIYTRGDYVSSVAFISWYLSTYAVSKGKMRVDEQYIIYHDGPNKEAHAIAPATRNYANKVLSLANTYEAQLRQCGYLSWSQMWLFGPLPSFAEY